MEQELIDVKGLLHRTMNDLEFAKDVLKDYLVETPGMIQELEKAIDSGNLTNCKNISHKLKGSSSSAGAIVVQNLSSILENLSDASNLSGIKNAFNEFKMSYTDTINVIKTLDIMK